MPSPGRPGRPAPAAVHYVDAALTVAACGAAFAFPVELFAVAFVVLGPLHYFTEIAWLEARGFFLPRRGDAVLLVGLAAVASAPAFGLDQVLRRLAPGTAALELLEAATVAAVVTAAGGALLFRRVQGAWPRLAGLAVLAATSAVASSSSASYAWFVVWAVLLPTLVHVYPFTVAFALHGALRERSGPGLVSVGALLGAAAVLLVAGDAAPPRLPGATFLEPYSAALAPVTAHLLAVLPPAWVRGDGSAASGTGLLLARLAAFAYTAHYLNWFTKTTVIGWHRLSPARLGGAGAATLACLALVAVDARAGLAALSLVSLLHVFLELPLDWKSVGGVGRELSRIVSRGLRRG